MSAEFTNPRSLKPGNQPEMATLDAIDEVKKHNKRAMWRNLALGMAWMIPVGYFLTHGQAMMPELETIAILAPHLKSLTIVAAVFCAASVLGMAIIFRRAFHGKSRFSLAIGMGLGFALGSGPAEIMAQLSL